MAENTSTPCPKCEKSQVKRDVRITGKANVCQECGWLEVASITIGNAAEARERARSTSAFARIDGRCCLCGKERALCSRLILGVHGGVCTDCVALCQDIIQNEWKPEQP